MQFARRCDEARPDLILALYGERPFVAGHLVLKGLGLKTALVVLPTYDAWVRRAWWKEIGKHALFRSADAAKVPGPDGLAYACRYGFTQDRVFGVRQSVTVDRYAAQIPCQERARIRNETGLEGCAFLYVGRLWAGKGLPELLDAFRRVTQANPAVSLLLVGDGPDEAALRTAAAGMKGVHFHRFVQAPELPQSTTAHVMCSSSRRWAIRTARSSRRRMQPGFRSSPATRQATFAAGSPMASPGSSSRRATSVRSPTG